MAEQTFTLARVKDNGRVHRVRQKDSMNAWTWCGLRWVRPSTLVMLAGVGKVNWDPENFLCGRCFPPKLRLEALTEFHRQNPTHFEARRDQADPAALLREAGQEKRDFARSLVDHSQVGFPVFHGPPDRFIRWESGEVWDWTPAAVHQVMFAAAFRHSQDTGDRPRPFPKPAAPPRPTLGLPHYRLSYRDTDGKIYLVGKVLAYRYWNTGQCSVAVVAKEGGVADWGAYIGALPNVKPQGNAITGPWVSEEEVVAHVIREGVKLTPAEARVFFADRQVRGIGLRCGQAPLPMEAYRK